MAWDPEPLDLDASAAPALSRTTAGASGGGGGGGARDGAAEEVGEVRGTTKNPSGPRVRRGLVGEARGVSPNCGVPVGLLLGMLKRLVRKSLPDSAEGGMTTPPPPLEGLGGPTLGSRSCDKSPPEPPLLLKLPSTSGQCKAKSR